MSSLVDKVAAAAKGFFDPGAEDELQARIDELDRALSEAERQKGMYYALVERLQSQRDEWRETYKRAVATYHESLCTMEQEVVNLRLNLGRLASGYNALRVEHGQAPVPSWQDVPAPTAPPVGIAREYVEAMLLAMREGEPYARKERRSERLVMEDRPSDTDGVAERDALAVRGVRVIAPGEPAPKKDC